jgi:hypothetical protein
LDGIKKDDPMNHGEVEGAGYEEARTPDAKVDLKKDTQKGTHPSERKACFRCGNEMHPRLAKISACCEQCTKDLKKRKKKDEKDEYKESTKVAATVSYTLPPPGIHMQTHALLKNRGLTAVVHYPQIGDMAPFSQVVPGNPFEGFKVVKAAMDAGIPLTDVEVQVDTDTPEEVLAAFDEAGYGGRRGKKEADIYNDNPIQVDLADTQAKPINTDLQYQCSICNAFTGTQQQVRDHVTIDHRDVLDRLQNQYAQNPGQTAISKDIVEDEAIVNPLPQSPGDNFDSMVQDLANRAAAIQFSRPDEEVIRQLINTLGVSEEEIKSNLQVVAVFDNYVGVNGEITDSIPEPPQGYQEVDAANINSEPQEALIPTDLVISKVAEQMNMTNALAYQQVKDRYGAELPDTYHAKVEGEYHYYLPANLAQQTTTDDVAAQQGIGPNSQNPNGAPIPGGADIPPR